MRPIGRIRTDFPTKFGLPRQSGLVKGLCGIIEFEPEYRDPNAFRGLSDFSHIWLIWEFSMIPDGAFSPTVRPPRLGGKERVGVFATRSPFRPNHVGLSCVKLERVILDGKNGPALLVSGIDMADMTPILDIKPYIPLTDCHPEASEGYTAQTKLASLDVELPGELAERIPADRREALIGVLSGDPRPACERDDPEREFGFLFCGHDVRFKVGGDLLQVTDIIPVEVE